MIWARKKTGAPVIRINSVAEANEFLKKYSSFVVGLFENFEVGHNFSYVISIVKSYPHSVAVECLDC